jgi:hypothetical protein
LFIIKSTSLYIMNFDERFCTYYHLYRLPIAGRQSLFALWSGFVGERDCAVLHNHSL